MADALNARAPLAPRGLPHREPFVFVREIVTIEPGKSAQCKTWFRVDDPMFAGHFPGNPLVPGVILTEALAQTAGIAAASGYPETDTPLFLLSAIRNMKFLRAVRPAEEVELQANKLTEMGELMQFSVAALTAGEVVAQGQIVLSMASPANV